MTLRLRVTGAKPSSVTLRIDAADPVTDTSKLSNLKMTRRGTLWSATYRTPAKPSLVAYSFRVKIGRSIVWYGDDDSGTDVRKGGTGKATKFRGDAFKLTVYDRAFTTPAWLQGAVVYEIFADRFRNGNPGNDYCRSGSSSGCPSFYGGTSATLHPTWNEPLEDSRATGVFNRDFFGGDLAGVNPEARLPQVARGRCDLADADLQGALQPPLRHGQLPAGRSCAGRRRCLCCARCRREGRTGSA